MRLVLDCPVWRTQVVIQTPSVVPFWRRQVSAVLAEARSVPRAVLQVHSASIGKRTLISIAAAIPLLAAVVLLVGTSVRDELPEEELIVTPLPVSPPASASDVQPVQLALMSARPANDAHVTSTSPDNNAEAAVQSSGAPWEFVPSPRPRPVPKSRQRRVHNMRNVSSNAIPILAAPGPVEIQPLLPRLALVGPPPTSDAGTRVQSFETSGEASALPAPPPADPIEGQPVRPLATLTGSPPSDTEIPVQVSGPSWELVPAPRPRPLHKPRPARVHKMRNLPDHVSTTNAIASLNDLRDTTEFDRIVKENPSNLVLLLMAEMRRASQETGRLIENLFDEIEPPALAKEMKFESANRAQLEAYHLDLKAAEANAKAAVPRYVALLESERQKVKLVVQSLNVDDRYVRAALGGTDTRLAQRIDITSKMLLANAELYRAIGDYVAILIEQFGQYKVSTKGHFIFSSESIADLHNDASRRINDAINRAAELDKERKQLTQSQQEEWERFASGK
jgi:hypothetical protein